jgi:hypothetical protein
MKYLLPLIILLLAPASAQEPAKPRPLPTQLSSRTLAPSQQVVFSIVIDGQRLEQPLPEIDVAGLTVTYNGMATRQEVVNGRVSLYQEIRYLIEATEVGEYTIPPLTLKIDGVDRTTESVTISVKDGEDIAEALKPQVQLSLGKTDLWVGEVIPINVTILVHQAVQPVAQFMPQIKSEGVAVARFDRFGNNDIQELGGEMWRSYRIPSTLSAIKSGTFSVGPAEVKADVIMPVSGAARDPFGRLDGSRRSIPLKSNTLNITVKELPELGRPATFNQAVGQFTLAVRANQQGLTSHTIPLGDPIAVEMIVSGIGNFDALTAPVLEKSDGLRLYPPRIAEENRGWGTEPGQKTFSQILFPEKPGSTSVVWVLSTFDPVSGKYVEQKSAPIELIVTGNPAALAAEANANAAETRDYTGDSEAAVPDEDLQDILPQALPSRGMLSLATLRPVLPAAFVHGLPAALLAGLLGYGGWKRLREWRAANAPDPNAPRELKAIMGDLRRPAQSYAQTYGYVSEYLQAWAHHRRGQALPNTPEIQTVTSARDRWLYATTPDDAAAAVPDAERASLQRTLASLS